MDIKKEELELLGVNKASIYTTKKGRERTTAVKMLFKYAPHRHDTVLLPIG